MILQLIWEILKKYVEPLINDAKSIILAIIVLIISLFIYTCFSNWLHNTLRYEFCYKNYSVFLCDHTKYYYDQIYNLQIPMKR